MKKMKNPCWKGYKAIGTKMKNGREVPNCVPIKETVEKEPARKRMKSFKDFIDEPKLDTAHRQEEKSDESHGAKEPALDNAHRNTTLPEYPGSEVEYYYAEAAPAWQRKEGKNPSGGLNKKGVASYRRANPGSKLQTAVTTKPSKLKAGSKAANRRKSFCARMGGMKKRLTSAKTARDPNSRINKALRKWNCR